MQPTLWSLSYSPWSDRARWALQHCRIDYRRIAYQPLLGEPAMRMRTGNWSGPVSVPVMQTDEGVLTDSLEICRYADEHRAEGVQTLFPAGSEDEIQRMHACSEAALAAGRTLGLRRILEEHRDALDAFVPPTLAKVLGRGGRSIAAMGIRRTIRKYAHLEPANLEGTLIELLDTLSEAIAAGTKHDDRPTTLLPSFSFADITMAVGLSFIVPPKSHLKLNEHSRRGYTWSAHPPGYEHVFAWRDAHFETRP
jgi:glutathione S-transferase